jgi:hypothetical protein
MGTHKLNFIKSNNTWFVDFKETELTPKINGVNQQHLKHLVGSWDTWLEIVSNGNDDFWMTISDSPILNGTEVKKLDKTEYNGGHGVYYFIKSYKGVNLNIEFWSCTDGIEFTMGYLPTLWYFIKHD